MSIVPCPKCDGMIKDVVVDEDSIANAKRVPVLVTTRCTNNHSVVLFVDRNFTIRDVEAAGEGINESKDESSVDKAQKWMDNF